MELKKYLLKRRGNTSLLARSIGAHAPDVCRWAKDKSDKDFRPVPIDRCFAIEKATNGDVSRRDLRPEDWQVIWPELCEEKSA